MNLTRRVLSVPARAARAHARSARPEHSSPRRRTRGSERRGVTHRSRADLCDDGLDLLLDGLGTSLEHSVMDPNAQEARLLHGQALPSRATERVGVRAPWGGASTSFGAPIAVYCLSESRLVSDEVGKCLSYESHMQKKGPGQTSEAPRWTYFGKAGPRSPRHCESRRVAFSRHVLVHPPPI